MPSRYEFPDPADETGPYAILKRLLATHHELGPIADTDPRVGLCFRLDEQIKNNRMVLGQCCIPRVQGNLSGLFSDLLVEKLGFDPDFLIILSKPFWEIASDLQREILVFHEALHMGQATDKYGTPRYDQATGRPQFCVLGHDIEEFTATVTRYGPAATTDIERFADAIRLWRAPVASGMSVKA